MTTNNHDPHKDQEILERGAPASRAKAAMIILHGPGASAAGIAGFIDEFAQPDVQYLIPQAAGRTWYPYPITVPTEHNQPHLDSALSKVSRLIDQLTDEGISRDQMVLLGFSQGACLALHYAAKHPAKYGGVMSLSGGLIGDELNKATYSGDLDQTPVFLGVGENETYFSLDRFHASADIMEHLNGYVTRRVYAGSEHQITEDEIRFVRGLLSSLVLESNS